ncbi:MAG TPA: hypothetical protein VE779_15970 [Candidatus Angelobacter sp.]|nr:hypothetical protein [Candidatus Angelobacter sp.]
MDADWSVELGAEDPALEFPWASPDGTLCYVDLQEHPASLAEIPEAVQFPELGEFLRVINLESSPWLTVKCDVWTDDGLVEAEGIYQADRKFCCYVDLIAREPAARFSFERHEAWVKSAARSLSASDNEAIACEFVVRRCWYHPGGNADPLQPTRGFYVTFYLSGYGRDATEAHARWAEGLRRVMPTLASAVV